MTNGFKKSDGKGGHKFIPTDNKPSGSVSPKDAKSNVSHIVADVDYAGAKELKNKKSGGVLGKDYHIYRVWQSDGNDRQEVAHIKAKNAEQAEEYVLKEYLTKEGRDNASIDGDAQDSYITVFEDDTEEIRDEVKREAREKKFKNDSEKEDWIEDEVQERIDMGESPVTTFEISEDDEEEEDFHTIWGGNDFVDLINPERSGKPTHESIKEHGGASQAFYKNSGKGFESGNPDNSYNLNTHHMKLHDPTKGNGK